MNIKESVAIVLANNQHFEDVDTFARSVFVKYCSEVPIHKDMWRAYHAFQIFKENQIRINYKYGLSYDEMEHFDSIYFNLDNNKISEKDDE